MPRLSVTLVDLIHQRRHRQTDGDRHRDVLEDNMVETKARSYWIKATYAYTILHD